jgi:hypothetical protein
MENAMSQTILQRPSTFQLASITKGIPAIDEIFHGFNWPL